MNKIQNLEEIFEKYKNLKNINNNSDTYNHRYINEVEIKINNEIQCNCELCKNEYSCIKKVSEMNKSLITGVNTGNLFFKSNKRMDIAYPSNNEHISYGPETKDQNNNSIFNKNKTLHTFVTEYEFISDKNDDNKKRTTKSSISHKLETKEPFKDEKNYKIDKYFIKSKDKDKKSNIDDDIEEEAKNKKRKKSKKSSKKRKEKKYKEY